MNRLIQAHDYARDTGRNLWEFAISLKEMRKEGVNENDLRWLLCHDYIQCANERTTESSVQRDFEPVDNLFFSKRSAFVITAAGLTLNRDSKDLSHSLANEFLGELALSENNMIGHLTMQPKWDQDRRELRVGYELVKVFRLPSPLQEAILATFEEEFWPPRIDDPLPPHPSVIPKRRLHDTIKSLNRHQKNPLIRFMGDGTGEGIRWGLVHEASHSE